MMDKDTGYVPGTVNDKIAQDLKYFGQRNGGIGEARLRKTVSEIKTTNGAFNLRIDEINEKAYLYSRNLPYAFIKDQLERRKWALGRLEELTSEMETIHIPECGPVEDDFAAREPC